MLPAELERCAQGTKHAVTRCAVIAFLAFALPAPAASQFAPFLAFESTDLSPAHWRVEVGTQFHLPSSPLQAQFGGYGGRAPSEENEHVVGTTLDLRVRLPVPRIHPFLFGGGDLGLLFGGDDLDCDCRGKLGLGMEIWMTDFDVFAEVAMVWPDERGPSLRLGGSW